MDDEKHDFKQLLARMSFKIFLRRKSDGSWIAIDGESKAVAKMLEVCAFRAVYYVHGHTACAASTGLKLRITVKMSVTFEFFIFQLFYDVRVW